MDRVGAGRVANGCDSAATALRAASRASKDELVHERCLGGVLGGADLVPAPPGVHPAAGRVRSALLREREFGEGSRDSHLWWGVESEFVVTAAEILHEGVSGDDHLHGSDPFAARASVAAGV